jgi:hypothetical protein
MITLAYGGFHSTGFWGMYAECLAIYFRGVLIALLCYIPGSLLIELLRWRTIGFFVSLILFAAMATQLQVMGEWGPAHVALPYIALLLPLLLLVLLVKTVALIVHDHRRARRPPPPSTPSNPDTPAPAPISPASSP